MQSDAKLQSNPALVQSRLARPHAAAPAPRALYTPEERRRRDQSRWTLVQGILAPIQFLVFAVSLVLVIRYLVTGNGLAAANVSVVIKTVALLTIMYTGALWEHDVYGVYLFARPFYWEDMVSMGVIALHLAYVATLILGVFTAGQRFGIALAAYTAYVVNATQFVLKLRAARRQHAADLAAGRAVAGQEAAA